MRIKINFGKQQIPWAMAAARAVLGPVLIAGDRCGWNGAVLAGLVMSALVSDIFDGVLARRWKCDTAAVRLFDSMADTVFYLCVAVAVWIGQPQVLRANAGLLGAVLGLEAMRFSFDFAKFGKPASYHSYLAKAWGLVMAAAVVTVLASHGSATAGRMLSLALMLGIASNMEGLAMSALLPVWCRDVKTLGAARLLRSQLGTRRHARRNFFAAATALLCAAGLAAARPALAVEPGHAAYVGGTTGVAQDTEGTLDTTSTTALIFRYNGANGLPGEIPIDYDAMRNFDATDEVTHHLGVLPAIGVGMVAHRQRRYLLTITYTDGSNAVQVAIFEVARKDQPTLAAIIVARSPNACRAQCRVRMAGGRW